MNGNGSDKVEADFRDNKEALEKVEAKPAAPDTTATAHKVADALDASSNSAELWRAHAAQIRSLAETLALNCENLAAELEERAKKFAGMVEMFAAYTSETEARIALEHQRLVTVNEPLASKTNGAQTR